MRNSLLLLVAKRVLWAIALLALLSVSVFVLAQVLPGDIARQILGQYATDDQIHILREQLGLDRPVAVRYWEWVTGFVTFNWGTSPILGVPVQQVLVSSTVRSVVLASLAIVPIVLLAYVLGVMAGKRVGSRRDTSINLIGVILGGIPELVAAIVLIAVFSVALNLLPSSSQSADGGFGSWAWHMILPSLALIPTTLGYLLRIVRAQAISQYSLDYVKTARLKGLREMHIAIMHVAKNVFSAASPVIGANFIYLVTGVVAIERIFNYPGIGTALLNAAVSKDIPVLTAGTMIAATIVIGFNLIADLVMILLNPKARARGIA